MKIYCLILLGILLSISVYGTMNTSFSLTEKDTLSEDYHILADAVYRYHYGGACGFAGTIPKGKIAIENLLKRNAQDEILAVLDGRNIEGKIFAIVALLEMSDRDEIRLKQTTKTKIKDFIESDYTINRCQGCVLTEPTTTKLFKEYKYARLLEKNDIWISKKSRTKLRLPSTF